MAKPIMQWGKGGPQPIRDEGDKEPTFVWGARSKDGSKLERSHVVTPNRREGTEPAQMQWAGDGPVVVSEEPSVDTSKKRGRKS